MRSMLLSELRTALHQATYEWQGAAHACQGNIAISLQAAEPGAAAAIWAPGMAGAHQAS